MNAHITTTEQPNITADELQNIARYLQHNSITHLDRDGITFTFKRVDDEISVMDHVNGCDAYGRLAWPERNRETGRSQRPSDFDGSARKFTATPMHDEVWWMPYRDEGGKVYDDERTVRFMERLLDWGFVGYVVETSIECESCGQDVKIDTASVWGVENPLVTLDDDEVDPIGYVTELLDDLVHEVSTDHPCDHVTLDMQTDRIVDITTGQSSLVITYDRPVTRDEVRRTLEAIVEGAQS